MIPYLIIQKDANKINRSFVDGAQKSAIYLDLLEFYLHNNFRDIAHNFQFLLVIFDVVVDCIVDNALSSLLSTGKDGIIVQC